MVTVLWIGRDKSWQVRTGVKYYFSSTVGPTVFKFGPPQTCVQFPNRTSLETLRPSEVVESALRHASVGLGVNWCEVQIFFAALPRPKDRWKVLE